MNSLVIILMLFIGAFGGFISGLVGIGGAIIMYPTLLIVPGLLGFPNYTAYVASGLTAVQVFFSTLSGSFKAIKKPDYSPQLVLYMGGGMILGSSIGAIFANMFDENFVNIVYIIIAILALILMFIKVKPQTQQNTFNKTLLIVLGLIIGSISGVVGAGGAFIIIPILLAVFKLPMNTVVANSIVIAFISSIGAFIIKLLQGYIPLLEAISLIIGSVIFAQLGLKVGQKIPGIVQKFIIIIFIIIAIIQISLS